MIKITAELNDKKLKVSSESNDASVWDVYVVLATIMRDFANRLNMNPLNMLEEIKVMVQFIEPEKEEEDE